MWGRKRQPEPLTYNQRHEPVGYRITAQGEHGWIAFAIYRDSRLPSFLAVASGRNRKRVEKRARAEILRQQSVWSREENTADTEVRIKR